MASADPISPQTAVAPAAVPLASIRFSRRTGHAVVIVERAGLSPRRHRTSLRRYAAPREWAVTQTARHRRTSGTWLRSSIAVSLWPQARA